MVAVLRDTGYDASAISTLTARADSNIIELGIRQIINPLTVLSLGVGAGIAEESPTMRVTLGIQYSF